MPVKNQSIFDSTKKSFEIKKKKQKNSETKNEKYKKHK